MEKRFTTLNAEVGDIFYERRNGIVTAVKVLSFIYGGQGDKANDTSYVTLLYPTGEKETRYLYRGSACRATHPSPLLFKTIEDCISGEDSDAISFGYITDGELSMLCGMKAYKCWTDFGFQYFAVKKWEWDGFRPVERNFSLSNYIFIKDEDGYHAVLKDSCKDRKLYDTREECAADNLVQVMTF